MCCSLDLCRGKCPAVHSLEQFPVLPRKLCPTYQCFHRKTDVIGQPLMGRKGAVSSAKLREDFASTILSLFDAMQGAVWRMKPSSVTCGVFCC